MILSLAGIWTQDLPAIVTWWIEIEIEIVYFYFYFLNVWIFVKNLLRR